MVRGDRGAGRILRLCDVLAQGEVVRLLTIDIETRPIEARTWGLWGQNIGINQITNPGGLLCFAAKFHGERRVHFHSAWDDGEKPMARSLHNLFDEADAIAG